MQTFNGYSYESYRNGIANSELKILTKTSLGVIGCMYSFSITANEHFINFTGRLMLINWFQLGLQDS